MKLVGRNKTKSSLKIKYCIQKFVGKKSSILIIKVTFIMQLSEEYNRFLNNIPFNMNIKPNTQFILCEKLQRGIISRNRKIIKKLNDYKL